MPAIITRGAASAKAFGWSGKTGAPPGQQAYTPIAGTTYSWVAPAGVTKVSVIAVGAGGRSGCGASGAGLGYKNNYTVIPGNSYTVVTGFRCGAGGGLSYFNTQATVSGQSDPRTYTGDAGYLGALTNGGGGGGAAGYSGAGNTGSGGSAASGSSASYGGASRAWNAGGGVGILGSGASGTANTGAAGSGGTAGGTGWSGCQYVCICCVPVLVSTACGGYGGCYGGGGGKAVGAFSNDPGYGGRGAVRIIWPGCARSFPSTRTADE